LWVKAPKLAVLFFTFEWRDVRMRCFVALVKDTFILAAIFPVHTNR
jgi:hypothetical protein